MSASKLNITAICIVCVAFELQWNPEQATPNVTSVGEASSGTLVLDTLNSEQTYRQHTRTVNGMSTEGRSSKWQYVALHRCSEHHRNDCYMLSTPLRHLPPPIPPTYYVANKLPHGILQDRPPHVALPLCRACRQSIADIVTASVINRDSGYGTSGYETSQVSCVIRVNDGEYDVALSHLEDTSRYLRMLVQCDRVDGRSTYRVAAIDNSLESGVYARSCASNVPWERLSAPASPADCIRLERHTGTGCMELLQLYRQVPYQSGSNRCTVCQKPCVRTMYHCSRCWFDVCVSCADRQLRRQARGVGARRSDAAAATSGQ